MIMKPLSPKLLVESRATRGDTSSSLRGQRNELRGGDSYFAARNSPEDALRLMRQAVLEPFFAPQKRRGQVMSESRHSQLITIPIIKKKGSSAHPL